MIIKDAFWQILGRLVSAIWWFVVLKFTTPFLWPLRFGDYNTILKRFAIWSALADFGLYQLALREIGNMKRSLWWDDLSTIREDIRHQISDYYSKFVTSRIFNACVVFATALIVAYIIPSYTANIYLIYWLPIGMIFASMFMLSGIVQIPLQLYRKMEQTSIALLIARISQIIFIISIVYIFWPNGYDVNFDTVNNTNAFVFVLVMWSVLVSWVSQYIYTQWASDKFIKFHRNWDREFTKKHILDNWMYGTSYFFSSFHILLTGFLLWVFFPTIDGFIYTWVRWLAMQLLEILLIIPSSMWNSLIHKIAINSDESKKKAYWWLMVFLVRLGWLIAMNFAIFSSNIINFTGSTKYLTSFLSNISNNIWWWNAIWSDYILSFLGVVVVLTFIKQTYNYIMITFDHQNKLFGVNGLWLLIGGIIWLWMIYHYNIIWWIVTQILLELLYVIWAIYIWFRYNINPIINRKRIIYIIGIIWLTMILGKMAYIYMWFDYHITWQLVVFWTLLNWLLLWLTYIPIKTNLREMW